jgi:hypothetical protein
MANWIYNTLQIYGSRAEIQRFLDTVKTKDSRFDFNTIIPRPDDDTDPLGSPWDDTDASGNPWGGRPAFELKIHEIKTWNIEAVAQLRFDTKWDPPIPVIKEASKQFPDLLFHLDFEEEDGESGGLYRARSGCDAYADTSKIARWEFEHMRMYKFEGGRVVRFFDTKRPDIE